MRGRQHFVPGYPQAPGGCIQFNQLDAGVGPVGTYPIGVIPVAHYVTNSHVWLAIYHTTILKLNE
jgi:hypothetical protein